MGLPDTNRSNCAPDPHKSEEAEEAKALGEKLEGLALRALGDLVGAAKRENIKLNDDQELTSYFDKSLEIFRSIGNDFEVARTLQSFGNQLIDTGDVTEGRAKLKEAKEIFERIESKAGDTINHKLK